MIIKTSWPVKVLVSCLLMTGFGLVMLDGSALNHDINLWRQVTGTFFFLSVLLGLVVIWG